jgi:hypothetical protein
MNWGRSLPLWLAAAGLGCADLDHFSTGPGESYCGSITALPSFRVGFGAGVRMRLKIDATALDGPGSPGKLATFEADDASGPARRLLEDADLRRIGAMEHDALSRLEFGEGRLRNLLFAVSPEDPPAGGEGENGAVAQAESILAILSLRNDESVEVRLLRPGLAPSGGVPPPEARGPLFGVFLLTRQVGTCGF